MTLIAMMNTTAMLSTGMSLTLRGCVRYVVKKMQKLIVVGMEALNIRHAIIKHMDAHGCTSCIHVCELSVVERMTHREWLLEGVQVGRLESDSVSFRNEGCRQLLVRLLRQRSKASGLMIVSPATLPFRGLGARAEESQQGVAAVSGAWETEMWDNRLFERKCEHVQFHGTCK